MVDAFKSVWQIRMFSEWTNFQAWKKKKKNFNTFMGGHLCSTCSPSLKKNINISMGASSLEKQNWYYRNHLKNNSNNVMTEMMNRSRFYNHKGIPIKSFTSFFRTLCIPSFIYKTIFISKFSNFWLDIKNNHMIIFT